MSEPTPFRVARQCLHLMSDETFLSTIDYVDFTNRYVSVKSGYWRHLVVTFKNYYQVDLPKTLLRSVKLLFLDRFNSVSATKLKKFFLGHIYCSFINYKNLLAYVFDCYEDIDFSKSSELRKIRYYEKQAKLHYLSFQNVLEQQVEEKNLLTSENLKFKNELGLPDEIFRQMISTDDFDTSTYHGETSHSGYIHNETSSFDYFLDTNHEEDSVYPAMLPSGIKEEYYDVNTEMSLQEFLDSVRFRVDYNKFMNMWQTLTPEEKIDFQLEYESSNDKTDFLLEMLDDAVLPPSLPALVPVTYVRRTNPELVQLDNRLQQQFETYGPPIDLIDVETDHNQEYQHIDVTSYMAIPED